MVIRPTMKDKSIAIMLRRLPQESVFLDRQQSSKLDAYTKLETERNTIQKDVTTKVERDDYRTQRQLDAQRQTLEETVQTR